MHGDQVKIKKESESKELDCCSDGAYYPYGTSLSVNDDLVDELDIGGLAVGDVVEVRGYAFVNSKSEHSNSDGSGKNINLQLTSLRVNREDDDRVKQLYGE